MYNCCGTCSTNGSCCLSTVLKIVFGLLLATAGIIFGALFADFFNSLRVSLIFFAIVLAVLTVLVLIYRSCRCRNNN